jgi:methylenetetrahydrofolate reductase (NADPH)
MAVRKQRISGSLAPEQRAALRALLSAPKFELIPLSNALEKAEHLPAGARVTVTASPSHGIEATLDLAEAMAATGHEVTPHLAAHMVRDRGHLTELLERLEVSGLRRAFVVGGDAKDRGFFHDGLALMRAMDELGHPLEEIGVPAYPEGHADIADDRLLEVLRLKQPYAAYMSTQMCFNPGAIVKWIARMRSEGVMLPVHLGIPGVAEIARLMTISARIGIADSARYLKKNRRMLGHLMKGSFGPDALLESLAPSLSDPVSDFRALHVFTFNQVEGTVGWRDRMITALEEPDVAG